jgi:hypothetical protein
MIIVVTDGGNPIIVDVFVTTIIDHIITIMIPMIVMITHIGTIATTITIIDNVFGK